MILAHGAGALSELPLPRWQFAWAIVAVVIITFFAVGTLWRRPVLAARAEGGWDLGRAAGVVARVVGPVLAVLGVVAYVVIVTAGLFGSEFPAANIAPIGVFVTFWVGVQVVSILVGDVWRALSPFAALALVGAWLRSRLRRDPLSSAEPPEGSTHWPAVAAVAAFVWLELAYHAPTSPRILGVAGLAYGVVVLAMAAWRGRGWLVRGEGFAALFGLLAAMAPLHRDDSGRVRLRPPLAGLARNSVLPGTLGLLFVVLGAAVFDGVSRTTFWLDLSADRVGWGLTAVDTLGLLWAVGIVALVYLTAARLVAGVVGGDGEEVADRCAGVLVPIAAAFTVAHHLSVLLLEGQGFWFLASDPYGEGWDLFGTADGTVDFQLLSVGAIAWIQAVAIAVGHAGAVLVAHDRAIADHPGRQAVTAQYVLLALVVGSATAAVGLLLGS
ncbi:MAG TPA: hypothetical protein VD926_01675 [Acidimicrobiales bacterium]|nr:hypothetical protein [Acidimicrobiales bacterium]